MRANGAVRGATTTSNVERASDAVLWPAHIRRAGSAGYNAKAWRGIAG